MIILLIPGGNRGCKRDRGSFFGGAGIAAAVNSGCLSVWEAEQRKVDVRLGRGGEGLQNSMIRCDFFLKKILIFYQVNAILEGSVSSPFTLREPSVEREDKKKTGKKDAWH